MSEILLLVRGSVDELTSRAVNAPEKAFKINGRALTRQRRQRSRQRRIRQLDQQLTERCRVDDLPYSILRCVVNARSMTGNKFFKKGGGSDAKS